PFTALSFHPTAPTSPSTLSLHDALPIFNIPLCLLAAAMIARRLTERVERRRPRIDYAGAAVLTAGLTLLILGLLQGGHAWAWDSDRKSTRLNSSHVAISYAVFCLKKKKK